MTAKRLANRAVIALSGAETHSFLQGLVTQDMSLLGQGAAFSCLLTPQGKILFDFIMTPAPEGGVLIDVWRDGAEDLAKRLKLYRLRAKIDIAVRDDLAVGVFDGSPAESDGAFADPRHSGLPARIIAPATRLAETDAAHDAQYLAQRIVLGVPEWGVDFAGDAHFLLDVNYDALAGVSYKKGCFVGQEVTSRMKRKADARRRTAVVSFEDAQSFEEALSFEEAGQAPRKGAALTAGEAAIGEILSDVAGGPSKTMTALATVRLDRWEKAQSAGAAIACAGAPVRLALPGYLTSA